MTPFEQGWYEKFMGNMVALPTLQKLADAGKLDREMVNAWVEERLLRYGI